MPVKGQKKIPIRRCVGCGEGKPKKELVRVVRTAEGEVSLDTTGRKNGRGAYVCNSSACLAKAQKKKSLQRAFGVPVPDEVFAQLAEQLAEAPPQEDEDGS